MKKRNKKAIIITAIVMFIGILMVLAGIFGGRIVSLFKQDFDYKNIKPEDLGKTITTDIQVYYEDIDLPDKALQVLGNINNDDAAMIVFDISALSKNDKDIYYSKTLQYITVTGSVRALSDEEYKEVSDSLFRFYEEVYYNNITSEAVFEESLLAEQNARDAESTGYLKCPACFVVSNMKSPVKSLTWQQAAMDYAEKCHGEIHLLNEGHFMYAKIPDEIVGIFKAFLQKNGL